MEKKSNQYSVRLDPDLQKDFETCLKLTRLKPDVLLRESILAFIDQVKTHGGIWFPLEIVPKGGPGKAFQEAGESDAGAAGHSSGLTPQVSRRGNLVPPDNPALLGVNEKASPGAYRAGRKAGSPKGSRA